MMSGFEITGMILTSCQAQPVQHFSIAPQSQSVLPCRSALRYGYRGGRGGGVLGMAVPEDSPGVRVGHVPPPPRCPGTGNV